MGDIFGFPDSSEVYAKLDSYAVHTSPLLRRVLSELDAYQATDYNPHFVNTAILYHRQPQRVLIEMSAATYKIDEYLFNALTRTPSEHLTARQLQDAYCRESGVDDLAQAKGLQKWIYRQVARLVRHGQLEKHENKNRRKTTYTKTATFAETRFDFYGKPHADDDSQRPADDQAPDRSRMLLYEGLQERAKQCHVDLLAYVGESEEYQTLFKSYPSLRGTLQPKYQHALETSSKLLGQLRAIEAALAHYKTSSSL